MYKDIQEYLADCMLATVGSYLDDNYKKYNFEEAINAGLNDTKVMSAYIYFTKATDVPYNNESNFQNFYLEKIGRPTLTEAENRIIGLIFQIKNDPNVASKLKEPNLLYNNICKATERIKFKHSMDLLMSSNEYLNQDPVNWTEDYYNDLKEKAATSLNQDIGIKNNILSAKDIADYYRKVFEDRRDAKRYLFHWKPIDNIVTDGANPGHGGCIAGSTGMGKSALCANILNHMIEANVPCMYFPIEMGTENSVDRLISMRTKIPYKELVRPEPENFNATLKIIEEEMKAFEIHKNFAICEDPSIDIQKLRTYVKQFQAGLESDDKYCVVIIDLMTMIKEFYMTEASMAQGIEKAINMLDILAKQLNFHYIGVVQLNRTVEQDKVHSIQDIDKLKPTRTSIKNSNAILERARYMISIFRPKYFADLYLTEDEASTVRDIAEIAVLKQNNGDVGKVLMEYNGPCFLMEEFNDNLVDAQ